jgi:hypothetical protein
VKIFGREPTLILQGLTALLTFLVTFGWDGLSTDQAAVIVAVVAAVLTAVNALLVRPVPPTVWTGVITAGASLLAAYGLDFSQERVGTLVMAVTAIMAVLLRQSVTPEGSPSNATVDPAVPVR